LYKLKHLIQRIREWWNNYDLVITDGKTRRLINLKDTTKYNLIGKQVGEPVKRKVSPKGDSKYAVALPEEIGLTLTDKDGQTEVIQVKIDGTEDFVAVLSKPKGA
jgi:hypothetical protein